VVLCLQFRTAKQNFLLKLTQNKRGYRIGGVKETNEAKRFEGGIVSDLAAVWRELL